MLFSSSSITSESVLKSVFVLHVVVDARDVVAVKHVAILARFVGGTPLKLALLVFPAASPPSFTIRMIRPTMSLPPKWLWSCEIKIQFLQSVQQWMTAVCGLPVA